MSAAVAEAKAETEKYTAKPSPFPTDEPFPEKLPTGEKLAYLQCVAPVCAQLAEAFEGAAQVIGAKLTIAKAGPSAQELQTAMSSLLEGKPDALLIPAVEPDLISAQLKEANEQNIPISSTGIMGIEKWGIQASSFGEPLAKLAGKLLADRVAANYPQDSDVVFYYTPELDFFGPEGEEFKAEMGKVCPECSLRETKIPLTSYGNSAPQLVVSDLQSNPDTTVAVFGASDPTTGVPAALKAAGIDVPYMGFGPTPSNLQDIQNGSAEAGLGLDYGVLAWNMVDMAGRLIEGAPLSPIQEEQMVPIQWLTQEDLPSDVSKGWTGYPDFVEMFTKLWEGK